MAVPTPADFMKRVVAWPDAGETAFINIHWKIVGSKEPRAEYWGGRAFVSLPEFVGAAEWATANPVIIRDVYFCLSSMPKHGGVKNGRLRAYREAKEAVQLKAIWLDVDVKGDPNKGYPSYEEAQRAIVVFCKSANIPLPTGMVGSGGGIHSYWISDHPLSLDEWRPYAEGLKAKCIELGLKADHMVTADAGRILRVPGTYNYKEFIPRPVVIDYLKSKDIDFETELGHIADHTPKVTATVTKPVEYDLSHIQMSEGFRLINLNDSLADGLNTETILSWPEMTKDCAFFRDAVLNGGKDHTEPLWSLALLACTFFENGDTLAHQVGNQHPDYAVGTTDAKYEQKVRAKAKNDLGWPSCKSISDAGCTFCAGCPHWGKIKSPVKLASVQPTPEPAHVNASISKASEELGLPPTGRYFVDEDGIICEIIASRKKGEAELPVKLFWGKITNPRVTAEPEFGFDFDVTTDLKSSKRVSLKYRDTATTAELVRRLTDQGCLVNVEYENRLRSFFMSWIGNLNKHIAAMRSVPFGWVFEDGTRVGFAYGGHARFADGRVEPSTTPDAATRKIYTPCGSRDAWVDALALVTEQKRPHLEAIVATAFATPILWCTGECGGSLGFVSESAGNKSTAVLIANAVWGHPIKAKLPPSTTERSLEKRMGDVNCLPVALDDFQTVEEFQSATRMLFNVTQGVTRGRLKQNIEQRETFTWKTMVLATANHSFFDYMIESGSVNTNAALYRMLEVQMPDIAAGTPGRVHKDEAGKLLGALDHNFGRIGQEYSKWLVENLDYVETFTRDTDRRITSLVGQRNGERFWISAIAGILAGAQFANEGLGTGFDVAGIELALVKALLDTRRKVEEAEVEGTSQSAIENIFSAFMTRFFPNQLWTENLPGGPGGKPDNIKYLKGPAREDIPVYIQWCVEDKCVLIRKPIFVDFLKEKKLPSSRVLSGLQKFWRASYGKKRLGGYTPWQNPPDRIIKIPIDVCHFLEPTLYQNCEASRVPDHVKRLNAGTAQVTATVTAPAAPVSQEHIIQTGLAQAQADLQKVLGS